MRAAAILVGLLLAGCAAPVDPIDVDSERKQAHAAGLAAGEAKAAAEYERGFDDGYGSGYAKAQQEFRPAKRVMAGIQDEILDVPSGELRSIPVSLARDGFVEYTVGGLGAGSFDVFLVPAGDEGNPDWNPCSDWATQWAQVKCELAAGEYVIAVDNSSAGAPGRDVGVQASVTLTAYYHA